MAEMASTSATEAVEDDNEEYGPTSIKKLEGQGITANDIKKLEEAGYRTVESIAFAPKKHLAAIKGIGDSKVDKLVVRYQEFFSKLHVN